MWRWLLLFVLAVGCGEQESPIDPVPDLPSHCVLPAVSDRAVGDASDGQWWLTGGLDVATTVDWPECPPLDESTADGDALRIVYPTENGEVADGTWPVVIFGHANSVSVCNPTDRYRSIQEQWASWGYIVVSVDTSEANCTKYDLDIMRGRIDKIGSTLQSLRELAEDDTSIFHERIDFDRVVAAGHSRGGAAAVVLASRDDGFHGAISLQGGNPPNFGLGETFTDKPVIGLTGQLDKDLDFPHVDLTEALLLGRYSWHTLRRGNHSFTADGLPIRDTDDPDEILERTQQIDLTRYVTTAYLAANFGVWDGEEIAIQPAAANVIYSVEGDARAQAEGLGDGFISRWNLGSAQDSLWIDRFDSQAPAVDGIAHQEPDKELWRNDQALNDIGGANACDGLQRCEEVHTYATGDVGAGRGSRLNSSLFLVADADGGSYRTEVNAPVGRGWRLHARVRTEPEGSADLTIVLQGDETQTVAVSNHIGELTDRYVQVDVVLQVERLDAIVFEVAAGAIHVDDLRLVEP